MLVNGLSSQLGSYPGPGMPLIVGKISTSLSFTVLLFKLESFKEEFA